jgi:hypothetical protein
MIHDWNLTPYLHGDEFNGIRLTTGLFVGLQVVGTEAEIHGLRARNPASLMYLNREPNEHDRWLLVMTDIRGRNEDEPIDDHSEAKVVGSSHAPQLRRVRVFRSVMGVPNDRIIALEEFMKGSVNLGAAIAELAEYVAGI